MTTPLIQELQEEAGFIEFDGFLFVRREGMGENDFRPAEKRDINTLIETIAHRVQEEERARILNLSERLYGDDRKGHFEDVIAVRVSKI